MRFVLGRSAADTSVSDNRAMFYAEEEAYPGVHKIVDKVPGSCRKLLYQIREHRILRLRNQQL